MGDNSNNTLVKTSTKEAIHYLQGCHLTYENTAIDYLFIVDWLCSNIWLDNVMPLVGTVNETEDLTTVILRVQKILNTQLPRESSVTTSFNEVPAKTSVEVTLL